LKAIGLNPKQYAVSDPVGLPQQLQQQSLTDCSCTMVAGVCEEHAHSGNRRNPPQGFPGTPALRGIWITFSASVM